MWWSHLKSLSIFICWDIYFCHKTAKLDHPPGNDVALELCKFRGQLPTFKLETAFSWFLSLIFGVTLGVFCLSSHKFMTKPRAWALPTEHSSSPSAGPSLPLYGMKSPSSVLEIPPILTLKSFTLKSPPHPQTLYKSCLCSVPTVSHLSPGSHLTFSFQ